MKKLSDFKCFEIEKNKLNFITGGTQVVATEAGTKPSSTCTSGCVAFTSDSLTYDDHGVCISGIYYNVSDCNVGKITHH